MEHRDRWDVGFAACSSPYCCHQEHSMMDVAALWLRTQEPFTFALISAQNAEQHIYLEHFSLLCLWPSYGSALLLLLLLFLSGCSILWSPC